MNKKFFITTILLSIISLKTSNCMQTVEEAKPQMEESEQKTSQPINMKKQKAYLAGKEYYKIREYNKAFTYFEYAANKEHIKAKLETASMLTVGLGCEEDLERALKLVNLVKKRSNLYASKKKKLKKYFLDISYYAKELWYDIVTKMLSEPREISLDLEPLQQMLQDTLEEKREEEDEADSTPHPGMYL